MLGNYAENYEAANFKDPDMINVTMIKLCQ